MGWTDVETGKHSVEHESWLLGLNPLPCSFLTFHLRSGVDGKRPHFHWRSVTPSYFNNGIVVSV